ncbi:MAG: hypothetical protein ACX93I_10905 [Winogradskyella sp.]
MNKSILLIGAAAVMFLTFVGSKKTNNPRGNENLQDKALSLFEIAKELGVTVQAVEYYISKGVFNTIKKDDEVFVLRSELNRVLNVNHNLS